MKVFLARYWFLLALLFLIALGLGFPPLGSFLAFGKVSLTLLVVLSFFIMGYTLPLNVLLKGAAAWRLHLFIQVFIFILTPLYYLLTFPLFSSSIPSIYLVGVYALSCLPTTMASAALFTQAAGGNAAGAAVSSLLSNMGGLILSPLLLSLLLQTGERAFLTAEGSSLFFKLILKIIVPLAAGQFLQKMRKKPEKRAASCLSLVNQSAILLIVFIAVSQQAEDPEFLRLFFAAAPLFLYLAPSFVILLLLAWGLAGLLRFSREDRIAVIFTAPQKTLALGAPLLIALFEDSPSVLGLAMLPILFYHPWQLFVSGVFKSMCSFSPPAKEKEIPPF